MRNEEIVAKGINFSSSGLIIVVYSFSKYWIPLQAFVWMDFPGF